MKDLINKCKLKSEPFDSLVRGPSPPSALLLYAISLENANVIFSII